MGPINRKHDDCIMVLDVSIFYGIKVVRATEDVIEDKVLDLIALLQ